MSLGRPRDCRQSCCSSFRCGCREGTRARWTAHESAAWRGSPGIQAAPGSATEPHGACPGRCPQSSSLCAFEGQSSGWVISAPRGSHYGPGTDSQLLEGPRRHVSHSGAGPAMGLSDTALSVTARLGEEPLPSLQNDERCLCGRSMHQAPTASYAACCRRPCSPALT